LSIEEKDYYHEEHEEHEGHEKLFGCGSFRTRINIKKIREITREEK